MKKAKKTNQEMVAKETIVSRGKLPGKKRNSEQTQHRASFMLSDGRYAYEDYDPCTDSCFYHVIDISDEKLKEYLDDTDHDEELYERYAGEAADYAYINHERLKAEDGDYEGMSPLEIMLYRQWTEEMHIEENKQFPVDPRFAIINCAVQQLPPKERLTYELLYNSYYDEKQIKKMLRMDDQAWWNNKKRLDTDMRKILSRFGYDVPTYEEIELEQAPYIKRQGRNVKKIRAKAERKKEPAKVKESDKTKDAEQNDSAA